MCAYVVVPMCAYVCLCCANSRLEFPEVKNAEPAAKFLDTIWYQWPLEKNRCVCGKNIDEHIDGRRIMLGFFFRQDTTVPAGD